MMEGSEYLIKLINEKYPSIDTRGGGPFHQFFIASADYLSTYFMFALAGFVRNWSIANYDDIPSAFMDIIGSNFFVSRSIGKKARGYVRVYFSEPKNLSLIASEVSFESKDGYMFSLLNDYNLSSTAMSRNITDDGFYYYIDLLVVADDEGIEYNISAHDMIAVSSGIDDWVKVDNLDDFESGADEDSNADYYNKIASSISPRDILLNQNSLEYKLIDTFPEIKEVLGLGFEDFEMLRDLIWDISSPVDKYRYILSYMDNKRFTGNTFHYNNLVTLKQVDSIWEVDQDYGSDFEITDAQYCKTRANDGDRLELLVGQFLYDSFDQGNLEFYDKWLTVKSGVVYPSSMNPPESAQAKDYIVTDEEYDKLKITESQDVAPIAIYKTDLTTNKNILIEGRFSTGPIDAGERGTTNYVLLTDNDYETDSNHVAMHFRGFGMAWRTSLGTEPDLFIVDNNAVEHRIIVGPMVTDHAQHVTEDGTGEVWQKPYLAATHIGITPNKDYYFKIYIYETGKIEIKVWETDGFEPADPQIYYGGGTIINDLTYATRLQIAVDLPPLTHPSDYSYYYNYIKISHFYSEGCLIKAKFTLPKEFDSTYKEGQFRFNFGGTLNPSAAIKQFELRYNSGKKVLSTEISWDNSNVTLTIQDIWKYDELNEARDKSILNLWFYYKPSTVSDILYIDCIEFDTIMEGKHSGGYIDAFVHSLKPAESTVEDIQSDGADKIEISTTNGFTIPFFKIVSIIDPSGPNTLDPETDYDVFNGTATLKNSYREDSYILITNPDYKGIDLDVTYSHWQNYSDYQTLADDILSKELCSDILVKEFYAAQVELTISLSGTYDADTVKAAIRDYINNLTVTQVTASDIEDVAKDNGASTANISDLSCTVYLPDRTVLNNWNNVTGVLSINISDTAYYSTERQCRFLIFNVDITIA